MPADSAACPVPTLLYSTTRQWNVGDDFILFGVRNLVAEILPRSNAVVYNRNPELHMPRVRFDRKVRLATSPGDWSPPVNLYRSVLHRVVGQWDNSLRPRHGLDGIDACIFAGTPEWMGSMVAPLVTAMLKTDIPTLYLGLGTFEGTANAEWDRLPARDAALLRRARLVTVRDEAAARFLAPVRPRLLACPALFAAAPAQLRQREGLRRIALSTQATARDAAQRIRPEVQRFSLDLFAALARRFDCALVCHYIDELAELRAALPGVPLLYSYDARDYADLYAPFDLTVTTRVHGAGLCAALGMPGFVISHSSRSATVKGFGARLIDPAQTSVEAAAAAIASLDVAAASAALIAHRERTRAAYLDLLRPALAPLLRSPAAPGTNPG